MKCIKKVRTQILDEDELPFYGSSNQVSYEDLVFDICLFSTSQEGQKGSERAENSLVNSSFPCSSPQGSGFVIGLQKIKGQPMLFLDYAQRLFSIFENAQVPIQVEEELPYNMSHLSPYLKPQ